MRKLLAIACCAVHLVSAVVAGAAHVHESTSGLHPGARGLHVNHAHLGDLVDHGHGHHDHHGHGFHGHGDADLDSRHDGHHHGDALYLTTTAIRSLDPGVRVMAATVAVGTTVDLQSAASRRDAACADPPGDPPRTRPTRPRAPPA